jgi:hypothetical protein
VLSDDWTSPVQPKLDLLARLQPNPNKIKGTAQGQVFLAGNTPRPTIHSHSHSLAHSFAYSLPTA